MKREILFRGKCYHESTKWIYGSYCPYMWWSDWTRLGAPNITVIADNENEYTDGFRVKVIAETVGQFTGLTDKNGTKIFEGDIIECGLERFTVEWDDEFAGFYLGDVFPEYQGCATLSDVSKDGVVIGNIYDNPELIGGNDE